MRMKVQTPFRADDDQAAVRVFLKFTAPSSQAGRKVIWGEDIYDGKMAVHEVGNERTKHKLKVVFGGQQQRAHVGSSFFNRLQRQFGDLIDQDLDVRCLTSGQIVLVFQHA